MHKASLAHVRVQAGLGPPCRRGYAGAGRGADGAHHHAAAPTNGVRTGVTAAAACNGRAAAANPGNATPALAVGQVKNLLPSKITGRPEHSGGVNEPPPPTPPPWKGGGEI